MLLADCPISSQLPGYLLAGLASIVPFVCSVHDPRQQVHEEHAPGLHKSRVALGLFGTAGHVQKTSLSLFQ